ncbi:MAG: flagellar basal body L-ring protein [Micavibrio sp.]|nr:flagellar basal body L-ring protein [Micavibrio sp.]|tara:strand:+ start:989 stop:1738 length:750 start_codon:yes stop_codon:yes gene_type:complete
MKKQLKNMTLTILAGTMLSACGAADRIASIGAPPEMSKITNPTTDKDYEPISLPMPAPKQTTTQKNSLWASDRQTFFKDQRAKDVGDIITVLIDIKDEATVDNKTERTRNSSESAGLNSLLGYEQALDRVLPEAINNASLVDGNADSNFAGEGSVEREEDITVKLAALITQILPNGNMAIHGRQEVLVNFEKRILQINGVIRPEDISTENTVGYDHIAEARIVYGGEGQISDVQQPRYGQQLYDIIFPF